MALQKNNLEGWFEAQAITPAPSARLSEQWATQYAAECVAFFNGPATEILASHPSMEAGLRNIGANLGEVLDLVRAPVKARSGAIRLLGLIAHPLLGPPALG